LLGRFRLGDQEAFEAIVGRYQNSLHRFFFRLCWDKDRAEDFTQDVFIKLLRGARNYYLILVSHKKTLRYIKAANLKVFAVFLYHQLGKKTPLQAVKPLLQYLQYSNVHIAIDPEFAVHGRKIRPGKVIGYIRAKDINQVQEAMHRYMQKHGIREKKMLLIHMFRKSMVRQKHLIKHYADIKPIMHLDGHGSSGLKVGIYNGIYTPHLADRFAGGFKLFFDEDKPRLMTPKQVMGLASTQGRKIRRAPQFISYQ
jgi:hypothetical protein